MDRRISVTDRVGGGCSFVCVGAVYKCERTFFTAALKTWVGTTELRKMEVPGCARSFSCRRSLGRSKEEVEEVAGVGGAAAEEGPDSVTAPPLGGTGNGVGSASGGGGASCW